MHKRLLFSLIMVFGACDSAMEAPTSDEFGGNTVLSEGGADDLGVTQAEARAILELVNAATLRELDEDVRLDRRAAESIVSARAQAPVTTLDELDAIPWVGARAFGKLREYVREQGLVSAADCLLISEYVEGKTNYNKAVELWNCGAGEISLGDVAICLVRNDDTDCTLATPVGDQVLGGGQTLVTCRTKSGTFNDPMQWLADACELEIGSTAIFSGDDRLALVRDTNGDGEWSVETDEVLDVLGRFTYRPWGSPWNDVHLERCRLEPNDGRTFYRTEDWFDVGQWSGHSGVGLGVPPAEGCAR